MSVSSVATHSVAEKKNIKQILVSIRHVYLFWALEHVALIQGEQQVLKIKTNWNLRGEKRVFLIEGITILKALRQSV